MSSYRGVVKAGNKLWKSQLSGSPGVLLRLLGVPGGGLLGVPGGGADGELGPVVHVVPAYIGFQTEWHYVGQRGYF